jgi:hypothetical protein
MSDRISVREALDRVYNSDMAIEELAKVGLPLATLDALANGEAVVVKTTDWRAAMSDTGYVVVPVEPTEAMIDAGSRMRVAVKEKRGDSALKLAEYAAPRIMAADRVGIAEAYRAMVAAAMLALISKEEANG